MAGPDTVVAYVAAPHAGYLAFFHKYEKGVLYILGKDLIAEFTPLVRNLPAPAPEEIQTMLRALGIFSDVRILTKDTLREILPLRRVVMPDEDVSHALAQNYLEGVPVTFDGSWRLRWDYGSSQRNDVPMGVRVILGHSLEGELLLKAKSAAERSSDWWRQVGALLAKDGEVLFVSYNKHMPSEHTAYLQGDPRANFSQGVAIEMSIASHAERRVQAWAGRTAGVSTEGCDLYVTTFPCAPCAYAWAESGIRRLYFAQGYSALEGQSALEANGIELIKVELQETPVPTT